MLLQILEKASEAEVVDVSTEKHQLWVNVIGHTVVGGHRAANNGWHNKGGGAATHTIPTAFYQGTKSGENRKSSIKIIVKKKNCLIFKLNKPSVTFQ